MTPASALRRLRNGLSARDGTVLRDMEDAARDREKKWSARVEAYIERAMVAAARERDRELRRRTT